MKSVEKKNKELVNLTRVNQLSADNIQFKKDLISLFLRQIPDFLENMKRYNKTNEWENLAREAHTAKSSVLIFGMEETAQLLTRIQCFSEKKSVAEISGLIKSVEYQLDKANSFLTDILNKL
ncbi:MAG: hypothetical protein CR996_00570 [Draconibacterium sp.]|nr:MAG: hypothetical protein CR996_00570 [Draconibacterium sp.]PIF05240.1 MAG: hypothetical protein CSA36_07780 [Draconibacterium sp.]